MDTLHDRLVDLAGDAPTGGAPAAELWARGRRGHRLRVVALAATVLVVGVVGAGIGVRLADGGDDRSSPAPAGTVGFRLPIVYPAGEALPDLGRAPGPLAAVWLVTRRGGAPEAVGLVAETGAFGTLPLDLGDYPDDPRDAASDFARLELSPDGRRIAYMPSSTELVVRDLVTGESRSPLSEFGTRAGFMWVDATHLVGNVAGGGDGDGWVWEPGTAPELIDYWAFSREFDLWLTNRGSAPGECETPTVSAYPGKLGEYTPGRGWGFPVPDLCDASGLSGSGILLGHRKDPQEGNGTVVALDIHAGPPFDDPDLRHVVAIAGAPEQVTFAADLVAAAIDAQGGAS
jgi:hypothetical protein